MVAEPVSDCTYLYRSTPVRLLTSLLELTDDMTESKSGMPKAAATLQVRLAPAVSLVKPVGTDTSTVPTASIRKHNRGWGPSAGMEGKKQGEKVSP